MVVALTEIVPATVRTAGFSLAYSLATALLGGFTPLVSTWLIELTGTGRRPRSGWRWAAMRPRRDIARCIRPVSRPLHPPRLAAPPNHTGGNRCD